MKFYNTAGPVNPARHYHLPPLSRFDLDEVMMLIHQEKYFILHAPRQTGKTSTLLALMAYLNNRDDYSCLYVNIESAQAARGDVEKGTFEVIGAIAESASVYLEDDRLREWIQEEKAKRGPYGALSGLLSRWSRASAKPVVLLLDEVDALVGDTLISLLRQIRAGYAQRPDAFPQSMVLCGVRDVRDYRMHQEGGEVITGGSAFNIKAKSLRMVNFTDVEVKKLFQQHTEETGQAFDRAIFAELWEDTRGQPWLVNALGHELTWEDRSARDRSIPITLECYKAARERLIESRATHLDQLTDKLKEPRVHAVIAALLSGEQSELQASDDDLQYVTDLGLIVRKPQVRISNRIYREVIPRELTAVTQDTMVQESSWYLTAENRLDLPKLLTAFQQCFREHSESWIERFDYKEAGPQLLMQAFLQRILNGGGRIYREYALGRKRTDLSIEWPLQRLPVPSERGDEVEGEPDWHGPIQRIVIELKIQRGGLESTIEKGLEQTAEYADQFGADESHLVIFNRDPDLPWEAKIWHCAEIRGTRILGVWGA